MDKQRGLRRGRIRADPGYGDLPGQEMDKQRRLRRGRIWFDPGIRRVKGGMSSRSDLTQDTGDLLGLVVDMF